MAHDLISCEIGSFMRGALYCPKPEQVQSCAYEIQPEKRVQSIPQRKNQKKNALTQKDAGM